MAGSNFPTPNPTQPGIAQAPFTNASVNAPGSNYTGTPWSQASTKLIAAAIQYEIFDAVPKQYLAMKALMQRPMLEYKNEEYSFFERTFGRTAITEFAGAAGGGATETVTLTGTFSTIDEVPVVVNDVLTLATGEAVMVTAVSYSAVANSTTLTVASQTGSTVPAIAAASVISIQAPIVADGMNYIPHYDRMTTTERWNFIQLFRRANRWSRLELQGYMNNGTTNYVDKNKQEKIDQLRVDMFVSMFNGTRGEFTWTAPTSGTYQAKAMGGLYPTMVAAGSQNATTPIAGLPAAFEQLSFATNYQAEGGVRFIYATDEMLYELSKLWKEDGVRYTPNDKIGDLNLDEYKLGTMRFIPIPCELFRENSAFPEAWQNRLIVVDPNSINPVKMQGIPHVEMGLTDNMQRGSYNDYTDFWVQANLGMQFNNPLAGFYINIV